MPGVRRTLLAALLACLLPAAGAGAADNRVIAANVSVAGVAVGGMTVDVASQHILSVLVPALNRRLVITAGHSSFHFAPGTAHLAVDGPLTAKRAYYAGVQAAGAPVSVAPAVSHDHSAVATFVAHIAARLDRPAQDATISIGLTHFSLHHSRTGLALDQGSLTQAMNRAIDSTTQSRSLYGSVSSTKPSVTITTLYHRYATIVTVDRAHFRLRLYKDFRLAVSYPIAVGRSGLETPTGVYHVLEREVNPSWHVPNDAWAGALAGQTIPPGPADPIVARWLGLGGGVGIHGTNEPFSIGSAASHGCIRMLPSDVIKLYPRVPLGTTVYIR